MRPAIPAAAIEANTDKEKVWKPSNAEETARRSIYAFIKRGLVVPLFETLDLADTVSSCPQRQVTTVAPQALSLFNGEFSNSQAQRFADRLRREAGADLERQASLAYRLTLAREPSPTERAAVAEFLRHGQEGGEEIFELDHTIFRVGSPRWIRFHSTAMLLRFCSAATISSTIGTLAKLSMNLLKSSHSTWWHPRHTQCQ